mmetsp:Transcript_18863/g.38353  ORF Transcript_18863/g.38353 Transcript_18863/m.38353 type:complete len:214 (+) Transcript_18863:560-1201(+)
MLRLQSSCRRLRLSYVPMPFMRPHLRLTGVGSLQPRPACFTWVAARTDYISTQVRLYLFLMLGCFTIIQTLVSIVRQAVSRRVSIAYKAFLSRTCMRSINRLSSLCKCSAQMLQLLSHMHSNSSYNLSTTSTETFKPCSGAYDITQAMQKDVLASMVEDPCGLDYVLFCPRLGAPLNISSAVKCGGSRAGLGGLFMRTYVRTACCRPLANCPD